ncbi:transmembrane protein 225 isoform X2 [Meriones unguiculatus]|uniref:transmembrane protein 225 isoform X2 n=1 Tax=Meriones unguiculatus TaxID=10047 RepID=UPI00293F00A6|nr:transmembrane protein 225 isoform X2 [Meriones unguiculatus]
MVHSSNRSIQAANIFFSSGAIVLLVVGLTMENWVELVPKVKKDKMNHSPWMGCCPPFWPEDDLIMIQRLMRVTLNMSIYINLIIGLQFTFMIPQNKCIHLFVGFLSFFTGIFCFIQCTNSCACLKFCIHPEGSNGKKLSGSSIQVISLPERTVMPRSIVHVHSVTSKDGNIVKPHVQGRRVTWAL